MLKRFSYIILASVLALFGVGTMATQSQATHPDPATEDTDCAGNATIAMTAHKGPWTILADDPPRPGPVVVDAMMFSEGPSLGDAAIPGPLIGDDTHMIFEGDDVCVEVTNAMDVATSVHWHGINSPDVDYLNDGVPAVGAGFPIEPGHTTAYKWTAPRAGTYAYHSHMVPHVQVMRGLYGAIIVRPNGYKSDDSPYAYDEVWMLSEWRVNTDSKRGEMANPPAMPHEGHFPNYFTINGKAFNPTKLTTDPGNKLVELERGEKARIRLMGIGQFMHTMHMHGRNFKEIARDSTPIPSGHQLVRNTVTVLPGDIVDIEFTAGPTSAADGIWVFHCHVLYHSTNDHSYPGGLVAAVVIPPL